MKKTLNDIYAGIAAADLIIARGNGPLPAATKNAFEVAIAQAKTEKNVLTAQYKELLLETAVALFLEGDVEKIMEVVDVVADESAPNIATINGNELYNKITDEIAPSMLPRGDFTSNQLQLLVRNLEQEAFALNTSFFVQTSELKVPNETLDSWTKIRDQIKAMVQATNPWLSVEYLKAKCAKVALDKAFVGTTFGAIIYYGEDSVASLFKNKATVELTPDITVTKNFIEASLKKCRKANKQDKVS